MFITGAAAGGITIGGAGGAALIKALSALPAANSPLLTANSASCRLACSRLSAILSSCLCLSLASSISNRLLSITGS